MGISVKEEPISQETAKLAFEKGCDLILYKKKTASFSRWGDATEFGQNYKGKLNDNSFIVRDFGRDEHGGNYMCSIILAEYDSLPTQSLLQKWLRDVHKIEISIICFDGHYLKSVKPRPFKANTYRMDELGTYEEVLEIALVEALNKIKTPKNG